MPAEDLCVLVWIDDYEQGTRYSKRYELEVLESDEVIIRDRLKTTLEQILSWPLGEWTTITSGFKESWSKAVSKEAFFTLNKDYPIVKTE